MSIMGRTCKVCDHPLVGEINRHLIMGDISQDDIAEMYGVSKYSISRHKKNHLGPIIEEAKQEVRDKAKEDFLATVDAYNMIISRLPDMLENGTPSFNIVLKALAERSAALGESTATQPVEVVWGMGNQELGIIDDDFDIDGDDIDESLEEDHDRFDDPDEYEDEFDDDGEMDYRVKTMRAKIKKDGVEKLFDEDRDMEFLNYAKQFSEEEESSESEITVKTEED